MADEVQAAGVFELRAEGGDFRAEIADLTEVAKRFERATVDAFQRAGKAASDTAALEASSKRYVSAIEREALATERKTAALVLTGAEMRKAEAAGRGESTNAAAAIARLEAAEKGYASLAAQMQQMRDINVFGDMLAKSTALGQVEKNIDSLTAALDRLQAEARDAGALKLSVARVNEDSTREAADSAAFGMRVAKAQELARAADYVQFWTTALDAADAKEKELADFRAFDIRLAEAAKLNKAADYVQFWGSALDIMEAKERELAAVPLFEKEKAAADKLRRAADATAAFTQLLDQLEAEEKKLAGSNAFVEALQRRSNAIGKTQADLLELEAAERGVSQQAAPFIANLRAQERAMGIYSTGARDARVSTNQLRTAMQQLPAQFTDVFTSLAGGQNPLLVLIQQGGQIKDSFGGVGNALKALGSIITPVRLLFGGLAAAAGVAGFAYKQASDETDAYRRAVVLSGNAAGTTVGQLQAMAAAVSALGGTQGKAAEVLSQLAASGKVAASQFAQLTAAAIALERAGGPAAKETAEAFIELGKAPSAAALKLTESTGFLTAELYKQVTALERQGRTSEAAAMVQRAAAQATEDQAKKLEGGLGTLQKAWRGLADAAKGAWDAALGVGRPETVVSRLDAAADAFAKANKLNRLPAFGSSPVANQPAMQQQYQSANAAAGYEATSAFYEKLFVEANKAGVEIEKLAESLKMPSAVLSDQQKQIKAWGDSWIAAASSPDEAAERAKAVGDVTSRAYSMSAQAAINYGNVQARITAAASTDAQRLSDELSGLQHQREMGLRSEYESIRAIAEAQVRASKAEEGRIRESLANVSQLPAERQQQERVKLEADLAVKRQQTAQITVEANRQIAESIYKRVLAAEAATRAEADLLALEQANNDKAIGDRYAAIATSVADYATSLKDAAYALQVESAAAVLPEQQREVMIKQLQNELVLRKRLREINEAPGLSPDQRDILRSQAAQANSAANKLAVDQVAADRAERLRKQTEDDWKRIGEDISSTLTDAIIDGGETGAKALEDMFKRLVLRPIIQAGMNQIIGTVAGALGGQGGVDAQGNPVMTGLSAASSLNTLYGYGQKAYGWWTGAGTAATSLGANTGAYTAMANSQTLAAYGVSGTGATTGGAATAAGSSGGSAAGSSAGVYAIYAAIAIKSYQQAQKDYAEGFRREQSSDAMNEFQVLRPIFGAQNVVDQIYRSLGLDNRSAAVLSGSTQAARLFGQAPFKLEETGITGTLGQGGFAGEQYSRFKSKGGFFRDDDFETFTSQVSDALQNTLATASNVVYKQAIDYGVALGLPAEKLGSVSKAIKVVLTSENIAELSKKYGEDLSKPFDELSDEGKRIAQTSEFSDAVKKDFDARMSAIGDALGSYGDELVKGYADALRPLSNYGETTAETLIRVGSALAGVNEVFEVLGLAALQASIDGGKAATSLIGMFGDIGTLQQAAGGYLQAYYSDAERANLTTQALGKALAEVGLAVPATREAFRSLVSSQDLTTESGRSAFTVLMSVAEAFASVVEAGRSAEDILKERAGLERELLQLQGDTVRLRALERGELDESNRSLFDQVRALEDRQALQSAVDSNVTKFMTPERATDYKYGTIARDLQAAGLFGDWADFGATLKDATKDEIYAVAAQFLELSNVSADAKIAMVEAAGALADLKDSAGSAADELPNLIDQFLAGLRSSDLSPLSFSEQLSVSSGLFESTLAGAKAGDADARQNLIGNAQAYLEEARAFFGSSMDYANIFARVTTELDAIGAPSADPQVQAIRDQVVQLEAMRSSVDGLATDSGARADTAIDLARAQISELQNVVQTQADTNAALAAGNRALWDQLEALNARVQRLLENAQLEATSPS